MQAVCPVSRYFDLMFAPGIRSILTSVLLFCSYLNSFRYIHVSSRNVTKRTYCDCNCKRTATFNETVYGVTTFCLTLQKDSHALPLDRIKMQNGNLTIRNLKDSDRGLYQCVASNEAATISSDTEIMIDNVAPRAPYNLSATSTENSVTLTWIPGFERPKAEYNVW